MYELHFNLACFMYIIHSMFYVCIQFKICFVFQANEELTAELVSHDTKNILLTEWQFQQTEDCHQILFTLLHLKPFTGLTTESTAQLITKQNI